MAAQAWSFQDEPAQSSGKWSFAEDTKPGILDKAKAFGSGLGTAPILHPIDTATSAASMLRHPGDTLNSIEQGREDTVDRAAGEFHKGNYAGAAIHSVLSLIPMIGPQLSEHYQAMRDAQDKGDEVAEANAAGKMIGLVGSAEAARHAPEASAAVKTAVEATPHVVKAIGDSGAAGDVAAGTAKAAAGAGLGYAAHEVGLGPLGEYLAAKGLVKSGVTQAASGIKAAYDAFKQGIDDYRYSQTPKGPSGKWNPGGSTAEVSPAEPAPAPTGPNSRPALPSGRKPGAAAIESDKGDVLQGDFTNGFSQGVPPASEVSSPTTSTNATGLKVVEKAPKPASYDSKSAVLRQDAQGTKLAEALHQAGASVADIDDFTQEHWNQVGASLGIGAPSKYAIAQARFQLQRMPAASGASPAMRDLLNKRGPMGIAQQLADELQK